MIILSQLWNKLCRMSNGALSRGEKNFSVHRTYMNFSRPRKRASETALSDLRGSLLLENGTNATPFSSDVFNKGTRASKRLADVSLYGRSMVEMLGVLAIIGVLSVGAISGYSKAMLKYKLNKQSEQINALLNTGIKLAGQFEKFSSSSFSVVPYYQKLGDIPSEMVSTNKEVLYDTFKNNIQIIHSPGATSVTSLYVYLNITDSDSMEVCRNVYNIAKPFSGQLYYFVALSNYGTDNSVGTTYWGDDNCASSKGKCIKDLNVETINTLCSAHMAQKDTHIKYVWKG